VRQAKKASAEPKEKAPAAKEKAPVLKGKADEIIFEYMRKVGCVGYEETQHSAG
jgi:hypothetical protein